MLPARFKDIKELVPKNAHYAIISTRSLIKLTSLNSSILKAIIIFILVIVVILVSIVFILICAVTWWRKLALLAHRGDSRILLIRGAGRLVFALFIYFFGGRGVFGAISLTLVLLVLIVLVIVLILLILVLLILVLLIIFFFVLVFRVLIIFIVVIVGSWADVVVCCGLRMDW